MIDEHWTSQLCWSKRLHDVVRKTVYSKAATRKSPFMSQLSVLPPLANFMSWYAWNEINICKMLCGLYKHWYRTVTASIFTCPSLDDLIPQPKILAWLLLPPFWRQWNQDTAVHLIIVEQACRASSGSIIDHLFWLNGQYSWICAGWPGWLIINLLT